MKADLIKTDSKDQDQDLNNQEFIPEPIPTKQFCGSC